MAANLSSSPTLISQEGKPTDVIVVPLVFPTVTPPVTEPVSLPPPLDSHDYGLEIQLSLWLLLIVSGAFLYPRIFCRISRHLTWWDDTLLAISWVCPLPPPPGPPNSGSPFTYISLLWEATSD